MDITFRGITVQRGDRVILQDVSGVARAGQVLAVMGPSGSGKTTLLNSMAGREAMKAGEVMFNGVALNKSMKRKLTYVLQQDVFFPYLTLRQTLSFATMIRLPEKMPKKEKMQRMDKIIDELDLRKCLDTIIGDVWVKGLSGGEKKRASIACELITDPAIIFMDEPTSGLDFSTAFSIVRTLCSITEAQNKTVVMSIHQPSSRMFFSFHSLLLLCDGELAYFGPCHNVIDFFADVGYPMETHYNPADFIIEKLREGTEVTSKILAAAKSQRQHEKAYAPGQSVHKESSNAVKEPSSSQQMHNAETDESHEKFDSSNLQESDEVHVSLMDLASGTITKEVQDDNYSDHKWRTGWITQYVQLMIRTFRQSRFRILNPMRIFESVVLCLLVSLAWFQLPRTEETLKDRMGVLFYIMMHWGCTPIFEGVGAFSVEVVVIVKERSAGWYRLSAYYMAKMTSELPLIMIQPVISLSISYWCVGFNGVGAFFGTLVVVIITAITGQSIGLLLGIACMDYRKGLMFATPLTMTLVLLGGFFVHNFPFWLEWSRYLSFLNYSFKSAMVLEFTNAPPILCATSTNASQFAQCLQPNVTHVSSHVVLEFLQVNDSFWYHFLPLLAFIFLSRLTGYLVMRFLYRLK